MKKFFAILMSLALMLSLAVPAMADGETSPATGPYKITIDNSVEGYTYAAYQIFTGDLQVKGTDNVAGNQTTSVLSNIEWGNGISEDGKTALYAKYNLSAEADKTAAKVAEALATAKDVTAFAKIAGQHLTANESGNFSATNGYEISGLNPGYYLVKNTAVPGNVDNTFFTDYIIEVVENSTVSPKGNYPTSNKKVMDTNDSTDVTTDWQDSADHDIGDMVPFKLTGTVPADYGNYAKYYFAFHDVESEGLDFDPSTVKVYVDGVEISSGYEVITASSVNASKKCAACTFEVVFTNLKSINSVKANSVITVEYKSRLNEKAKIGIEGNPNTMDLEYSNNPHENWEGKDKPENTGKTPEDKVIVFTYKTIINKVDGNQASLSGAEFTLYKEVAPIAENTYPTGAQTGAAIKAAFAENVNSDALKDGAYYVVAGVKEVTGEKKDIFTFKGLDDGTYVLVETQIPEGYNAWKAAEFKVTAEHVEAADNPTLTSLSGNKVTGDITFTPDETAGSLSAQVINNAGATLPETGGMGTTIFYVVGGVMVAAAAILLITKKRLSNNA